MINALSSALTGLQANEALVNQAAADIANQGASTPSASSAPTGSSNSTPNTPPASSASVLSDDLPNDVINIIIGERGFEANAKTIEVTEAMWKKAYQILD